MIKHLREIVGASCSGTFAYLSHVTQSQDVALISTWIAIASGLFVIVSCCFTIAGVVHNWNKKE